MLRNSLLPLPNLVRPERDGPLVGHDAEADVQDSGVAVVLDAAGGKVDGG